MSQPILKIPRDPYTRTGSKLLFFISLIRDARYRKRLGRALQGRINRAIAYLDSQKVDWCRKLQVYRDKSEFSVDAGLLLGFLDGDTEPPRGGALALLILEHDTRLAELERALQGPEVAPTHRFFCAVASGALEAYKAIGEATMAMVASLLDAKDEHRTRDMFRKDVYAYHILHGQYNVWAQSLHACVTDMTRGDAWHLEWLLYQQRQPISLVAQFYESSRIVEKALQRRTDEAAGEAQSASDVNGVGGHAHSAMHPMHVDDEVAGRGDADDIAHGGFPRTHHELDGTTNV